jgi:hypothetical protein
LNRKQPTASSARRSATIDPLEPRRLFAALAHADDHASHDHAGDICILPPPIATPPGTTTSSPARRTASSDAYEIPALSSRPSAAKRIFLDFDGDTINSWGGHQPGVLGAMDYDNNAGSFSTGEQLIIRRMWEHVSEMFSPFDLNVTTVDPGTYVPGQTMRILFTPDAEWTGLTGGLGIGGIAQMDGFRLDGNRNTAFVFAYSYYRGNSDAGLAELMAPMAAHEAGHGFGLVHQSEYDGSTRVGEYHSGTITDTYIMGAGAERRPQWHNGTTYSSASFQDDLAILSNATNGFGSRADDVGNTRAASTAIGASSTRLERTGVIHNTADVDVFAFTHAGGSLEARVTSARTSGRLHMGMLDATLELRNAAGTPILQAQSSAFDQTVSHSNLPAGTYYMYVSSAGNYGDIGSYRLVVTPQLDKVAPITTAMSFDRETREALKVTFSEDVGPSVDGTDVVLINSAISQAYYGAAVTYDAATRTATFTFRERLPDGHYTMGHRRGETADAEFNDMTFQHEGRFSILTGDLDRNGTVGFSDLVILAGNYNAAGKTYSQGNIDYSADGRVNFSDLVLLAGSYNKSLPPPAYAMSSTLAMAVSSKAAPASRARKTAAVDIIA